MEQHKGLVETVPSGPGAVSVVGCGGCGPDPRGRGGLVRVCVRSPSAAVRAPLAAGTTCLLNVRGAQHIFRRLRTAVLPPYMPYACYCSSTDFSTVCCVAGIMGCSSRWASGCYRVGNDGMLHVVSYIT